VLLLYPTIQENTNALFAYAAGELGARIDG